MGEFPTDEALGKQDKSPTGEIGALADLHGVVKRFGTIEPIRLSPA